MIIKGLDGEEYNWKYYNYKTEKSNASKPHIRARELLYSIFPFCKLAEEIPLVGTFKEKLILDIYVHTESLAIEVQGAQHYEYKSFFFKDKKSFSKAQARDRTKIEWCKINNIDLVQLPDNESNEEWEKRIRQR